MEYSVPSIDRRPEGRLPSACQNTTSGTSARVMAPTKNCVQTESEQGLRVQVGKNDKQRKQPTKCFAIRSHLAVELYMLLLSTEPRKY